MAKTFVPVFCKNCSNMVLVDPTAGKVSKNMRCTAGIRRIIDSYVDGSSHWDIPDGKTENLPSCEERNKDGTCSDYHMN
jgi:hypothetical protein